jgi:hypothetical protein
MQQEVQAYEPKRAEARQLNPRKYEQPANQKLIK